jgi:hypothetical protein
VTSMRSRSSLSATITLMGWHVKSAQPPRAMARSPRLSVLETQNPGGHDDDSLDLLSARAEGEPTTLRARITRDSVSGDGPIGPAPGLHLRPTAEVLPDNGKPTARWGRKATGQAQA